MSRLRGACIAFAVAAAVATVLWAGASVAWAGFGEYLVVGLDDRTRPMEPFTCESCFLEGAPRTVPHWAGALLAVCPLLVVVSASCSVASALGIGKERLRTAERVFAALAVVCGLVAVAVFVWTTEVARSRWALYRFERGDLFAPMFPLFAQQLHTRCTAAAAAVVAGSLVPLAAVHRSGARLLLVAVALAHLAAAALAFARLDEGSPQPLVQSLSEWGATSLHASIAAGVVVMCAGLVSAWFAREAPSRLAWSLMLTWLAMGVLLGVRTLPHVLDLYAPPAMAHRPPTIPPSSGPRLPLVEHCRDWPPRAAVLALNGGGYVRLPFEHLEGALGAAGSPPVLVITSSDGDAPTGKLDRYFRAAQRHGVGETYVAAQHLVAHPSATYGAVHDRLVCVVPAELPSLFGTRAYHELVERVTPAVWRR